ncbi:MAG: phosphoribosylanthranilate isomerase [Bacteroidota bacterium]
MKIKVCGITTLTQLQTLHQLGVNYAGLILYDQSKRFAGEKLHDQKEDVAATSIKKIGVFVNAQKHEIKNAVNDFGLYAVQLHGSENEKFCSAVKQNVAVKLIKVFRLTGNENIDELVKPFAAVCDYFLFDTGTEQFGGSGIKFDWTVLRQATVGKPFFLSGGIGPNDVGEIKSFMHPFLFAVDVNSRFETEPGVKDMELVKQFVNELSNG